MSALYPPKVAYFGYLAGWAMIQPFLSLILRGKGYDTDDTGMMLATYPLCMMICAPMWAFIAEKVKSPEGIFALTASGASVFAIGFVTSGGTLSLWFMVGYFIMQSGHFSILDRLSLAYTELKRGDWGRQRVFGSAAWGVFVPIAGVLYDHNDHNPTPPIVFALCLIIVAVTVKYWMITPTQPTREGTQKPPTVIDVLSLCGRSKDFLLVFTCVSMVSTGVHLCYVYVYLHLDDLGASKTLIGFTTMVGIASEIPVFIYSSEIRKRVGGTTMIFVGCVAQSMRFFGYSIITEPGWAFVLESMHGVAYGLSWSAAVAFVNENAPPGMTTPLMGLLNGVSWGVGPLIGTLVGGFIYYHAGASVFFCLFATLLLIVAGLFAWIERPFESMNLVLVVKPPSPGRSDIELNSQKDDAEDIPDNLDTGEIDIQIEHDGDTSPGAVEVREICQTND